VDGEARAMTRAIGMLVGVLLMLWVFLLVLGPGNSPTLVKAVVSSEDDTHHVAIEPAAAVPVGNAIDSPVLPVSDTDSPAEADQQEVAANGLALEPQSGDQSMTAHQAADHNDELAVSRYRVWSPFRSEWAANGFARRLSTATDIPVEVLNESPGNYQVIFSYRDDGERQAMVEHIETITGLELE